MKELVRIIKMVFSRENNPSEEIHLAKKTKKKKAARKAAATKTAATKVAASRPKKATLLISAALKADLAQQAKGRGFKNWKALAQSLLNVPAA